MPKLRKCCVVGCYATSETHRLFNFPKVDKLRELWLSYLVPVNVELSGLSKAQLLNRYVCQKHFDRHQFDGMGNRLAHGYPCLFTANEMLYGIPLSSLANQNSSDHNYASQPTASEDSTVTPSMVVDDADLSVTEEDNDGNDSNTPVESNMCRVCLALDVKMYDLRDNELKIMFQNITGIMLNEDNHSVLGSLCWECAARLKAAATFRSKARLSDSLLQDLITSGEQIRKNDITALKENALSEGLISAQTLTVTDVFHIIDIEEQNSTTQLFQSVDDGDQILLSKNNDTEKSIIQEIKELNSEMYIEKDDNIAINTEIEDDPSSSNNEERNTEGENQLDNSSSSQDKIKSTYSSLWLDVGQCFLLRKDILGSTQEDSNTDRTVINTISKRDLIPRTGPQQITEPTNRTKRKTYGTSRDHRLIKTRKVLYKKEK